LADAGPLTPARELSADQRLDELSALLAIGIRRVLAVRADPAAEHVTLEAEAAELLGASDGDLLSVLPLKGGTDK
ncbi:MAG TPA: hypothetical protein VLJ38_13460, partial [Polyangiaceae bacterium]|nr:hypothetical protein [Polyangiaceae bacterium]